MEILNNLQKIGLTTDNSIVISSGILQALEIRKSNDIDLVVSHETYDLLKKTGKFTARLKDGREILADEIFEIAPDWTVLGKLYRLEDFEGNSIIIKGVRYITLDFLYEVKKSWASEENPRQKDIDDVKLIEKYLSTKEEV